ncbi:MAG: HEAT repeat domain-containing protein [Anaerolineae bacterium]
MKRTLVDLSPIIAALGDPDEPLTAAMIYNLSEVSGENLERLALAWPTYPVERRRQLVRRLGETSEMNFEVNFDAVNKLALEDADAEVRVAAIEGLWENESVTHMRHLTAMAVSDSATAVRAAAVGALGRFILLGEYGKLPERDARLAQDTALDVFNNADEDLDVRRRALEAVSNCGREGVAELIEEAYMEPSIKMRASALFAMGRSCDLRWRTIVMDELGSEEPEILYEAARAAGELELRDAVRHLGNLLVHEDREVQEMAVWALGEIGGKDARRLLEDAADTAPDAAFAEAVDDALNMAYLIGGDLPFDMFHFDDFDGDDFDGDDFDDAFGNGYHGDLTDDLEDDPDW